MAKFYGLEPGDVRQGDMNLFNKELEKGSKRSKTPTINLQYLSINRKHEVSFDLQKHREQAPQKP